MGSKEERSCKKVSEDQLDDSLSGEGVKEPLKCKQKHSTYFFCYYQYIHSINETTKNNYFSLWKLESKILQQIIKRLG